MSGRADVGPIAGIHGARDPLIVGDDCKPACEICMSMRGGAVLAGSEDKVETRTAAYAEIVRCELSGIVRSCGVARCSGSTWTLPSLISSNR